MFVKQPDSLGIIKVRFSKPMSYPLLWHEKLKNDTQYYEQIIQGNRDQRWEKDKRRELGFDDSNDNNIFPDFEVKDYYGDPSDLRFRVYLVKMDE
jgi:hypothetical protein